ncbi:TetR family transcriptional regulator [Streptomyces luteolus]|uniref:TetR family transcriptional regulator n=1 Tax=Streptomyces luteolus TaxID=3043615 RepID=A0ABT6T5F2_9ACTN|nr:TetR family transcriptional regulator [Streptomyces sp. B-S-A12]MDI3423092.1 TetR family transcriptional regulator [Streptomyces sp. B-S-A12]
MSDGQGPNGGVGNGSGKPSMREALIAAAFELFLERGFEQTTIDDIVQLAGVGRRSFFRYFPSKEDVVFPDHERCLADMTELLEQRAGDGEPVTQVCDAARLVMRMYAADPAFSVKRYELTKSVPALRAHELSVVWRYEHTLADYLRRRFAGWSDGTLRADVIAASVVAAHNNALRSWLRAGGKREDVTSRMNHALEFVQQSWGVTTDGTSDAPAQEPEEVVVLIAKRRTPMWRVVREIESTLDESERN